jgi:hypothetical protein
MKKQELIEKAISDFERGSITIGSDVYLRTNHFKKYVITAYQEDEYCGAVVTIKEKEHKSPSKWEIDEFIKKFAPYTGNIGIDPFVSDRAIPQNTDISQLIHDIEKDNIDFDPYVVLNGEKIYYQRELVWTLEQKKNFIRSIFNRLTIGILVYHVLGFDEYVLKENSKHSYGIIDGLQRVSAIKSFINDEFDVDGVLYSEMSDIAIHRFGNVSLPRIMVDCTESAEKVLKTFISMNNTGTPHSEEHLQKLKNLL